MKISILFIGLLCLFSCAEKDKGVYLQQHHIQLEQPRVSASNTIIDSSVLVTAELRMDGVEIFYTSDGSEPLQSSQKYESTLDINHEGVYRFRAFHPDWKTSAISELKLYKKGFTPYITDWQTNASTSYPGQGESTLINNQKGALNFKDQQWLGFDTIAKASVTFFKYYYVESLTIGYLVDTKSWIFPPESVLVIINEKDTISVKIPKLENSELLALNDVRIPIEKNVGSITVIVNNTNELPEWHPGKGLKAWLFMDEWIFN